MAVYKPTYCYPYLNSVDIRTTKSLIENEFNVEYLTCKIDTSNSQITGYSVRLLDEDNNQIFPVGTPRISPITELQIGNMEDIYEKEGTNSGLNGTQLQIPFFQNTEDRKLKSYNSIYYCPKYAVDHIIMTDQIARECLDYDINDFEDSSNWSLDGETLVYNNTPGLLDGIPLVEGDTVLVFQSLDTSGIWKADKNEGELVLTPTDFVGEGFGSDIMTVITKGDILHNCVLKYTVTNDTTETNDTVEVGAAEAEEVEIANVEAVPSTGLWEDIEGNEIPYLQVDGRSLKWEIVLYQGNFVTVIDPTIGPAWAISYEEIKEDYLDIKLNTGTILGSTPERVQIASEDPSNYWLNNFYLYKETQSYPIGEKTLFENEWYECVQDNGPTNIQHPVIGETTDYWKYLGSFDKAFSIVLPTASSGTIVLQGKYMGLGAENNGILKDTRIYVKSYDASYGHVYPRTDSLESNTLGNSLYCQFFEHSNNPNEILDTDIVDWGIQRDIPLYVDMSLSVTDRYIAIDDRNLDLQNNPLPDFSENETVLLTGQGVSVSDNASYQNGVYVFYKSSKKINEGTPDEHTFTNFLKRAPSYNTWAPYIGKIFYCRKGDYGAQNIQSLAPAGSYTLWNPLASTSGSSSLLFTPELPILIFPQRLQTERTYDLYYSQNYSNQIVSNYIDDQTPLVGNSVLFADGNSGTIIGEGVSSDEHIKTWQISSTGSTVSAGEYVYILEGQNYGKRVFKWTSNGIGLPNWDLHTAAVLRNMPNLTYISPYNNLKNNMMLKLSNGKQITYKGRDLSIAQAPKYANIGITGNVTVSKWIYVQYYDSQINYVIHPEIDCSSEGLDIAQGSSRIDGYYGLASYGKTEEVPWKYEVRSFFASSNENAFYTSEDSYVIFKKDGEDFTNLEISIDYQFNVFDEIGNALGIKNFYVRSPEAPLSFVYYVDQQKIKGRSLSISADYKQYNQVSWESFRWALFDSNGNLLQDTGEKYEGNIETVFYGLINSPQEDKDYYVALTIKDITNDTLCTVIKFTSTWDSETGGGNNNTIFTATLDQQTHSVSLNFVLGSEIDSSQEIRYSYYRREYDVYENPGKKIFGYLDNNVFYSDRGHEHSITPVPEYIYIDKTNQTSRYGYIYNFIQGAQGQYVLSPQYKEFIGNWEPVLLRTTETEFRDYNITAGRSYQYIVYITIGNPGEVDYQQVQVFANYKEEVFVPDSTEANQGMMKQGTINTSMKTGAPVRTCWNEWSIVELIPEENNLDAPIVSKVFKTKLEQTWLFKFSLETGTQTQNISRSEFQTLGQFPRVNIGKMNYASGDVSALLGSEIIPYSATRYIERLGKSRENPLSTNEKVAMLRQWQKLVYSKNPKLLTDIKGQSWIVQIFSSSNKPQNFYHNQPDTISFQWKQISGTENIIVYGDGGILEFEEKEGTTQWSSAFKK